MQLRGWGNGRLRVARGDLRDDGKPLGTTVARSVYDLRRPTPVSRATTARVADH
jgi:hypothetical protein